jgi:hypothetical protein
MLGHSKVSQHFMEPEGSVPNSQELSTCSRPGPRLCFFLRNKFIFYDEGLLAPLPTPKLEDHPLSFVLGCLFYIFAAALHSWRLFLHPQPEDAPCCGDRDPPNIVILQSTVIFSLIQKIKSDTEVCLIERACKICVKREFVSYILREVT